MQKEKKNSVEENGNAIIENSGKTDIDGWMDEWMDVPNLL